ncbi:DEAD/DEAH box helicase [Ureibacillus sp. FSL K6-8385]|uniref:DEAD/DEAH box helicase n=1 Tax=Ureibacillus TaxID=160795 RepID=UPI002E1C1333|nr:DEAD/DEAH box helicase [Ureibacillus terrenus]MED3764587.1 DEAD/DEAH box helicase [Ureibacillus terrenus]
MKQVQVKKDLNTSPFATVYQLSIEQLKTGVYRLRASENGRRVSGETFKSVFFFRYEPNFYGLHAVVDGDALVVTAAELVECLSPKYRHPFAQFEGATKEDEALLECAKAVAPLWSSPALWNHVKVAGDELGASLKVTLDASPAQAGDTESAKVELGEALDAQADALPALEDDAQLTEDGLGDALDLRLDGFPVPAAQTDWAKEEPRPSLNVHLETASLSRAEELLTTAIQQKFETCGLEVSDAPSLLPFFQEGGWPLEPDRSIGPLKVALRLNEPEEASGEWVLETVILSSHSAKHWTPAVRKRHHPIREALPDKWKEYADEIARQQKQMLQLLGLDVFSDEAFLHVSLTDAEVRTLLRDRFAKAAALRFEVILPGWLKDLKKAKMRVRVSARSASYKSVAGLDDILSFRWELSIGGERISPEAFRKIVEEKREFIRIGNEWFRLDNDWMAKVRELMDKAERENWTVKELVFREVPEELMEQELDEEDDRDDPLFAFEMQRSLKTYVHQLLEKRGLPPVKVPESLNATLRPYQKQGFDWLVFMRSQRFGAILADDMGLGKTVQLIGYVLHVYEARREKKPTLVVCPTSVLGNWQKELERFAPGLKVYTHYGSGRLKGDAFHQFLEEEAPHVVLSTYGTIAQDVAFLEDVAWAVVTLDEAQNIKNMQTQQSKAIRRLHGDHHIALTGTPIENRLAELWAIFDFIHRGYLGSFKKFQEEFIVPIERDGSERHKERLRAKIRPFLLRRTKTDPDLQLNLPDKQETKEFCPLTEEQAALYEGYIQESLKDLEKLPPFERKGRILQMLSKLKQLCNHPALYLKEPFGDAPGMLERSVKLKRIVELTKEIVDGGEQCLIFTQYIGMGQLLQHCFFELYGWDVPFLTGSMRKEQRDALVEAFQAGEFPVFLLSLKAGGTGLNLTAASHVLHADRWWNPAVENQATDRAYRIGQKRFVQVHKFITIGTIEEKVDDMLEMKSALSEELIQASNWLTELDTEQLLELLK